MTSGMVQAELATGWPRSMAATAPPSGMSMVRLTRSRIVARVRGSAFGLIAAGSTQQIGQNFSDILAVSKLPDRESIEGKFNETRDSPEISAGHRPLRVRRGLDHRLDP